MKEKLRNLIQTYKWQMLAALGLSLLGIWWGLPVRLYEDESVLQKLNLDILKGQWEKGIYFQYGNLAQIIHCLFIWPALFTDNPASCAVFLARCFSSLLAALMPVLLGEAARLLWNSKTARFAAWSAALCPAVITYGHFGTVDLLQLFFLTLGLWSSLCLPLFLTGFICGLGTAIKFQGWLMILPALVVFLNPSFRRRPESRPYFLLLGLLLGFSLGMPWLWINPSLALKWALHHFNVDGFSFALAGSGYSAWLAHPANLLSLLGPLFFVSCALGLFLCRSFPSLLLLSSWLPFYLLSGSFQIAPARQSLALMPAAILYTGWFLSQEKFKRLRTPVLALSATFAVWLVSGFLFDSRFAAARWIEKNIPLHATAEITPYAPQIRVPLLVWSRYSAPRDPLSVKPIPSWLRSRVQPFIPSDLKPVSQTGPEPEAENYTQAALARRSTQFVILSDWYVERYRYPALAAANPARAAYYLDFWEGRMPGYVLLKRFKFFPQAWWAPKPEFVDPEIRIYAIETPV